MKLYIANKSCPKCRQQLLVALHHMVDRYVAAKGLICLHCGFEQHFSGKQVFGFYTGKNCREQELRLPGKYNEKAVRIVMANKSDGASQDDYDYFGHDDDEDDDDLPQSVIQKQIPKPAPPANRLASKPTPPSAPPLPAPTASDVYQQALALWTARKYNREMIALFEQATGMGHRDAPYYLARYYLHNGGQGDEYNRAGGWFHKALELGCRAAQLEHSSFYYDLAEKAERANIPAVAKAAYEKAARAGHSDAQNSLGVLYAKGELVAQDYKQAVYWYEQGALNGNQWAMRNLAFCYRNGTGCEKNLIKAFYWFEKIAASGDREASRELSELGYRIGSCYYHGNGQPQDYRKAFEYFERSARSGSAAAQNYLGVLYFNGYGVAQDDHQAVYWYEQAANKGNSFAMKNLAYCHKNGRGVKKNYIRAAQWLEKAAELGDDDAPKILAELSYTIGEFLIKSKVADDKARAFEHYSKGWKYGNAASLLKIGLCFQHGYGVKPSYADAIVWYEQAASHGIEKADAWLGNAYYEYGKQLSDVYDYEAAVEQFQKGADLEDSDAIIALAECYFNGEGVDENDDLAAEWYAKASESTDDLYIEAAERCFHHGEYDRGAEWLKRAAEVQSGPAMHMLGRYYAGQLDHTDVDPDYEQAVKWYELAYEHDHLDDEYDLHMCYCQLAREAVRVKDFETAIQRYTIAEQHYPRYGAEEDEFLLSIGDYYFEKFEYMSAAAWYEKVSVTAENLAYCYWHLGMECDRDHQLFEAYSHYEKAAQLGLTSAQYETGKRNAEGRGLSGPNYYRAVHWYGEAVKQRHTEALHDLAVLFMEGKGTAVDLEQAEQLMHAAYLQGYDCYYTLGTSNSFHSLMELYKIKYEQDYERKALSFIVKAAQEINSNDLYYQLGVGYETGYFEYCQIRSEPDLEKAFFYYHKAVDKDCIHLAAAYRLANCYRLGIGTESDNVKAVQLFALCGEWGHTHSLNALGESYFSGHGVEQDYNQTFVYCSKAAELGHAEAQFNIGFCYENGYGVQQDMVEAFNWYNKSAEQGFALAIDRLSAPL